MSKKVAVLLAGSGVYDGSEIHEATFTLLALAQQGFEAICVAPNREQMHVVNHISGEEMSEQRNILIESARIARGAVTDLAMTNVNDYDALVIPGGFGAAKNLNQWAVSGPDGAIFDDVKSFISEFISAKKPVVGLCMGPTVIAKALQGTALNPQLTVGTTAEASPYDIGGINAGMESIGAQVQEVGMTDVVVDTKNNIITAPCYMMEGSIVDVYNSVSNAIAKLAEMIS